jgi:hypothetical protein
VRSCPGLLQSKTLIMSLGDVSRSGARATSETGHSPPNGRSASCPLFPDTDRTADIADSPVRATLRHVRCQQKQPLFDELIGTAEQRDRHRDATGLPTRRCSAEGRLAAAWGAFVSVR